MDKPHPTGLKPTLRQMMIVVLWAALLTAGIRAAIHWQIFGDSPEMACVAVPINLGIWPMPLLAALIWLLDRPGQVRTWYRSVCMIVASFLSGILFSLQDLACYYLTGRPTLTFPMGPIASLVFFWCGWMQWQQATPRRCPSCERKSVIPVARPLRPGSKRMFNTGKCGWCAICGASCERESKEEWRLTSPTP